MNIEEETLKENDVLEYLNVRENKIEKSEELIKLKSFSNLQTLVLLSNPLMTKESTPILEILSNMKNLQRINKNTVKV